MAWFFMSSRKTIFFLIRCRSSLHLPKNTSRVWFEDGWKKERKRKGGRENEVKYSKNDKTGFIWYARTDNLLKTLKNDYSFTYTERFLVCFFSGECLMLCSVLRVLLIIILLLALPSCSISAARVFFLRPQKPKKVFFPLQFTKKPERIFSRFSPRSQEGWKKKCEDGSKVLYYYDIKIHFSHNWGAHEGEEIPDDGAF